MGKPDLSYGSSPGLRFACVLDGKGGGRHLDWQGVRQWRPADGPLWVHLERDAAETEAWVRESSGIDPVTALALLADESRPRVEADDEALLVLLRGVNRLAADDPVDLVPIHLYVDAHLLVSVRDRDHSLMALRDIREALVDHKGPRGTGDLLARIAEKIVKHIEPLIDELDEETDRLDKLGSTDSAHDWRSDLVELRSRAVELRRYLSPQRDALYRLQNEEVSWLQRRDQVRLREITDRIIRYCESLDVIRDRTTLLHENLTAQISERIARTSNRLTGLAALLLPPSLVTGMFGMNVGGIPFAEDVWGFAAICTVLVVVMVVEAWVLHRLGWF